LKSLRIFILTFLAMLAFASNSLLCRLALKLTGIDAASFTLIRILSGALALWLIANGRTSLTNSRSPSSPVASSSGSSLIARHSSLYCGTWFSALALFTYAAAFSFAYLDLSAGTGALLLFGAVQATMILWGLHKGERLDTIQIVGFVVAVSGLVVLIFPGLTAPPLRASILMVGAGVAWGVYSLRGKTAGDAVGSTAGNFLRAVPFATALSIISLSRTRLDRAGILYAVISGAVTSGLGYVIWYSALSGLKATGAATVQLSVPVLAAAAGIILLHEPVTVRYVLSSMAVLGGILLVVIEKR
jgi:drug/metabolite transporter (DMT)-like permease